MPPDFDPFEQNRIGHVGVAVDAAVGADDRAGHRAAGDDRAEADDAVEGLTATGIGPFAGEDELRRREALQISSQRPAIVVNIQQRVDADEVHVRFVISVERADVAPVGVGLEVLVDKRVGEDFAVLDDRRNDVLAEVVLAVDDGRVAAEFVEHQTGREDVDPHRGQAVLIVAGDGLGRRRLFDEADDAVLRVDLHHAEGLGFFGTDAERSDGEVGPFFDVRFDEPLVVHLVDVVAGQDDDVLRALFLDRVNVLVDGVGGPHVPVFVDPLLRRDDVDELTEFAAEQVSPAEMDVPVEAGRLVLREDQNLANPAVQTVGQREIDDAIRTPERNGGLGPIAGQRLEARPFSAGQHDRQDILHRAFSIAVVQGLRGPTSGSAAPSPSH